MKHLLLLISLFTAVAVQSQTWMAGSDIPTAVRAGNTAGYSKDGEGYLFVVSGRDFNGLITKKHQRYQMSTNTWTELAEHPTGLLGAATTILKDSLYVIGGLRNTPGTAGKRCYKYSINENTWVQIANFPVNITDAKAVSYQDSLIYVTGGYTGNTYVYNSHYNRWRPATAVIPGGSLSWNGFAIHDNTLTVVCGTNYFMSPTYLNTVRRGVINQNDRAQITWTEGTPFPGQSRTFFDSYSWENGIIMTGGSTDNTFETTSNECYSYNTATDSWAQLPNKPTAWVTGNSASVQIGPYWGLICSSGYASDYLSQTEILWTGPPLSIEAQSSGNCSWKNFQIFYGDKTRIHFCLSENGAIDLEIFDAHGRKVKAIQHVATQSGLHSLDVDTQDLSKGIYYCTLKKDSISVTKKMIVSK